MGPLNHELLKYTVKSTDQLKKRTVNDRLNVSIDESIHLKFI